jgi:type IV pilus secretin PilQ/predicted competence protein
MMRWANGLLVAVLGGLCLSSAAMLAGCAPPAPVVLDQATHTEVQTAPVPPGVAAAKAVQPLELRELKIIDDNGQEGLFAKLSRPPRDVTHYALSNPSRVVVEITGETAGNVTAEQYPVQNNPLIKSVRVGSDTGKIRITVALRTEGTPNYTVDDLNDTMVAFIGEPKGTQQPVREQVVFTQRALPGAPHPVAPVAVAASAPPPAHEIAEGDSDETANESTGQGDTNLPGEAKHYYGQPVSLDLKDADIHNVLRLLAEVSNLNIVATDDVKGQITLRLFDVPWDQALDIILQVMNLESVQEGNVLRISTVKRLREEREELHKAQQAAQVVEPLHVAYLQVNYAKAKKLADLISGAARSQRSNNGRSNNNLEEEGVLSPRGSVLVDEFTNTLIVRDIRRGIENARELVRRLDVQIPQVLIESNIVEATTDFARDLGIQWGYQANIGPQTGTSTGANFPGTIGAGGGGGLNSGTNGLPFIVDFPASGAFAPGSGSALGLALGSLDGAHQLDMRLSALEQQGKGRIISRPRVVTLNNVAATIKSLTILRVKLPSTGTVISTGAGGQAGTAQTATEKIETGIILTVTPQVSSDGFVLLDMYAKSSQADFTRTVDNIPTEISREATSHILVRDGQTVVLGGIYRDTMTDNNNGVPFLSQIPGLSWLFHSESKANRREDLLVFLTPRVIGMGAPKDKLPSASELWQHRDEKNPG